MAPSILYSVDDGPTNSESILDHKVTNTKQKTACLLRLCGVVRTPPRLRQKLLAVRSTRSQGQLISPTLRPREILIAVAA